ncbi:hypothetical protein GCM10027034_15290 [Ramlibacter solisilvae]|uniref:Uncharacterized protein n=1 Tax=Ramlibacter tataouinensis TaxID=94132 RepID=A0A127JWL4_9BURK|nr:hypothetical protein [Ramlibacter tataouinensis]AMO24263.1 hypothetical protein UC35_17230 [Ramlibacter tataouinensis]
MAVFRALMLLMLVASGISFVLYATTGQMRYRRLGLTLLTWTLAAGFVFFAVLIAERLME